MGEVYLAYDAQLDRHVALKILPHAVADDSDRMQRFIREAKSASALNHPNILTIHEIGDIDEVKFIATEFIDGETLRQRMIGKLIKLSEVLDIATQVASALAKAHASGIIHRDIKPENIMVTRDGYVKVLDFGLAKLCETPGATVDGEAPTIGLVNTEPGRVMGTTRYMSPEQARGLSLDARTDIWSLGVVLYELVTGQHPFAGATNSDLLVSILDREPPPVSRFSSGVPDQVDRIIRKALAKDADERYQVIKDLQIDLRNLKRELEVEAEIDRTVPPELRAAATASATHTSLETPQKSAATSSAPTPPITSDTFTAIKQHRTALLIGLGAVLILAVALFVFLYANRGPALTEKDTILLADFANTTGDQVFDGTLKQALAVQLGQSPYLDIFADERVRETLRFMGRSDKERVTREIGREVCQRHGIKALLAGSISNLGSNYVITLEALNAQTGDSIAREQVEAPSKEQVLKALGGAASNLREKLGESLASIQKFGAPGDQVTTSSLEALKAYAQGEEIRLDGKYAEAIIFYKRATEIDPLFAMAYAKQAVMSGNLRLVEAGVELSKKAYDLRDRVSERERFYIISRYYQDVVGDVDQAIEVMELWQHAYPRDFTAHVNQAGQYSAIGQPEKAAEEAREAIRLNPKNAAPHGTLAWTYLRRNQFAEARSVFEQALAQKLETPSIRVGLFWIAVVERNPEGMKQQIDWSSGTPSEALMVHWQAANAIQSGELRKARALYKRGFDLTTQTGQKERMARFKLDPAFAEMLVGNCRLAKEPAAGALALSPGKDILGDVALIFALCGEAAKARPLIDELAQRYPHDTFVNTYWLPAIRAAIEIDSNQPARAIELLEAARRTEFGTPPRLWPAYVRGLAYLRLGSAAEAIAEFQKILDHRGVVIWEPSYALAHLGLARALALKAKPLDSEQIRGAKPNSENSGDAAAAARKAYQDFFALWKDADQDIPILQAAQREYEKLK